MAPEGLEILPSPPEKLGSPTTDLFRAGVLRGLDVAEAGGDANPRSSAHWVPGTSQQSSGAGAASLCCSREALGWQLPTVPQKKRAPNCPSMSPGHTGGPWPWPGPGVHPRDGGKMTMEEPEVAEGISEFPPASLFV